MSDKCVICLEKKERSLICQGCYSYYCYDCFLIQIGGYFDEFRWGCSINCLITTNWQCPMRHLNVFDMYENEYITDDIIKEQQKQFDMIEQRRIKPYLCKYMINDLVPIVNEYLFQK